MYTVPGIMVVPCGICAIKSLIIFVLHGGKPSIEYGMYLTIKEVIFAFDFKSSFLFYEICCRIISFIDTCTTRSSELFRFIVRHGLYYACMNSPLGRNASSSSFWFVLKGQLYLAY
jgi:hypothetical protein